MDQQEKLELLKDTDGYTETTRCLKRTQDDICHSDDVKFALAIDIYSCFWTLKLINIQKFDSTSFEISITDCI